MSFHTSVSPDVFKHKFYLNN